MAINKRLIKSNDEGGVAASFNTVLFDGNGGTLPITDVGFQPDLVWIKTTDIARNHLLFDSVRGATKFLHSNTTEAEQTVANSLTSFDSQGFTLGNWTYTNTSGLAQVAWCLKAAGYANTFNVLENGSTTSSATAAGAGITAGSLTNGWSVSANRDSGFSIVRCEPSNVFAGIGTVGHGLNNPPKIIIIKSYDPALADSDLMPWMVYSEENGADWEMQLNTANAKSADYERWERTSPTSSVFTLGQSFSKYPTYSGSFNIAYCFAEVAGFSKFGSYTGNGSTSGPTVSLGFEPAFVMIKNASINGYWHIIDNKRSNNSGTTSYLFPNESQAEATNTGDNIVDFLSNGFQVKASGATGINGNGNTLIYMAFANQF